MINASIHSYAMENGLNINIKKIMDFAELALKKILNNSKELRKILILISCLIAKELANKKI